MEWVVISVLPQNLLYTPLVNSIQITILITIIAFVMFFIIFTLLTRKLLRPMNSLLQAAKSLSSGDLSKRVKVKRNDEIGKISVSFNDIADKMQYLINNLESAVREELKNYIT